MEYFSILEALDACEFEIGRAASYVASIRDTNHYQGRDFSYFHFAVWLAGQETTIKCRIVSQVKHKSGDHLMHAIFANKNDRDRYLEWKERFSGLFTNMDAEQFPAIPTTGSYNLHFTEYGTKHDWQLDAKSEPTEQIVNAWVWIAHHFSGKVFRTAKGFAFTVASDAVAFKLAYEEKE